MLTREEMRARMIALRTYLYSNVDAFLCIRDKARTGYPLNDEELVLAQEVVERLGALCTDCQRAENRATMLDMVPVCEMAIADFEDLIAANRAQRN